MIEVIGNVDHQNLLDAYKLIEHKIIWADGLHKGKQSGLQYYLGGDVWLSATGKSKRLDHHFDQLNPFFADTPFEDLINQYGMTRTRLMWLGGNACYSFHCDDSPRIHVPIITNPHACIIFLEGPIEFLKLGNVYRVDTTKVHTAINGADTPRLHLVGEISN